MPVATRLTSSLILAGLMVALAGRALAQGLERSEQPAAALSDSVSSSLPDAPSTGTTDLLGASLAQSPLASPHPVGGTAGPYDKNIQPGVNAPRLSAGDKFILGLRDSVSPLSAVGWLVTAGYEQVVNGSPNYGQTGKGFAQRLGAAAARSTSENIIGESILSPLLHEDPRYYKLGRGHNFFKRLAYAGTRPLIGRTDGGHMTVNLQELGGDAAGSAMTNLYYPQLNRGFTETAKTFGGSVGGTALGDVVVEFFADTLQALHISKQQ